MISTCVLWGSNRQSELLTWGLGPMTWGSCLNCDLCDEYDVHDFFRGISLNQDFQDLGMSRIGVIV
ncbi:MAG: hypothetical protein LW630_09380 [Saprospiraceae bacterium]|jgi:hypothetical protein|nr:hypothetical protein [Saprospiraceae bacterium]